MQRKIFQALAFTCLFSILGMIAVLLYTNNTAVLTTVFHCSSQRTEASSGMDRIIAQQVQELLNMTTKEKEEVSLPPCPDVAPQLVGPILVEFDSHRTMDYVRDEVGSSLQEGGRYKPPDCISLQKVAIIIPFHNWHEHLTHWLYYLHPVLKRQQLDYGVYVINQEGGTAVNRGKLMNVGFAEAQKDYDYDCFVFSDVDMVPMNDLNLYRCYDQPRHLSVAIDKFNFRLTTLFGGVCSLSKEQFLEVNGFSNSYWGWGGEDDDLSQRIALRGMYISRPDSETGKYRMIKNGQDLHNDPDPETGEELFQTAWAMDKDGLNSLMYTVKTVVKDTLYTLITVDVHAP